ncbi:MAG: hypothetical protein ACRD7E_27815, partial [Bryobacteraceae bacterium]
MIVQFPMEVTSRYAVAPIHVQVDSTAGLQRVQRSLERADQAAGFDGKRSPGRRTYRIKTETGKEFRIAQR